MLGILRDFRRLVEAILQLVDCIKALVTVQEEAGPALDRLEALELSRHQFEAEVQGALLEAKGKLKASLSSEARERHMRKQSERDIDAFSEDGEEVAEAGRAVQPNDVEAGEAEGVSPMRLDVAPGPKAAAVAAKWAR